MPGQRQPAKVLLPNEPLIPFPTKKLRPALLGADASRAIDAGWVGCLQVAQVQSLLCSAVERIDRLRHSTQPCKASQASILGKPELQHPGGRCKSLERLRIQGLSPKPAQAHASLCWWMQARKRRRHTRRSARGLSAGMPTLAGSQEHDGRQGDARRAFQGMHHRERWDAAPAAAPVPAAAVVSACPAGIHHPQGPSRKREQLPPWRQPRGKWMVSLVNSNSSATRIVWNMWEIDLRFAPELPPGWLC